MKTSTRRLAAIALFSAIATLLMWFPRIPLIPTAPFMTYDFSDIPVLIGTFALGPVAGFVIATLKALLHFFTYAPQGWIGVMMNWSITVAFILPAGLIYHLLKRDRAGALVGMAGGTVLFTIVAVLLNVYVALPLWGIPAEQVAEMVTTVVIPFNLLRGIISTVATMLLYRRTADLVREQLNLQ